MRRRPEQVTYAWTWPQLEDVEPVKTAQAHQIQLSTGEYTLTELLAARKKTLTAHLEELRREREAFEAYGLPLPTWLPAETNDTESQIQDLQDEIDAATADA